MQASSEEVWGVVVGAGAALGAAAAARAGLPLLLLQPAPPAPDARFPAALEALSLYPHPDVLAMVTSPATHTHQHS